MTDGLFDEAGEPARPRLPLLVPLSIASFAALLNVSALSPFVAPISVALDRPVPVIGYAATAGLLTTAICGVFVGWLADRAGFRPLLVIGTALLVAGSLGAAASFSFSMFLSARVIGSVGFTAVGGLPNAVIVSRFSDERRRRGLAWISAASVLASLVGPPVLAVIGDLLTWRAAFVAVASVSAIATVGVLYGMPADTPSPGQPENRPRLSDTYRTLLGSVAVMTLFGATILQMAGHIGSMIYLGAYLVEAAGLPLRFVGLVFAVQGFGGLIGSYLSGRLQLARPVSAYTIALASLAATQILIYGIGVPTFAILALLFVNGISQLFAWLTLIGVLARVTPAAQGATMVLNGSMLGLGGAAGAALGGVVIGAAGYAALGILFPVATLLSVALFASLRDAALRPSPGTR